MSDPSPAGDGIWRFAMTRTILPDEDMMKAKTDMVADDPTIGEASEDALEEWRAAVNARRNVLLGLWAARQLGLPAEEGDALAWSVHFADLVEPGHDDVIRALQRAFADHGVSISDSLLREQLHEMTMRAELDLDEHRPGR
jgi:hypothetical protein